MTKLQKLLATAKTYCVPVILLIIASLLTTLNQRVTEFPEWGVIIAAIVLIVVNIYLWIKKKGKKLGKILIAVVSVIVILCNTYQAYFSPYWNSYSQRQTGYVESYDEVISCEDALEDLNYVMRYVRKCHPVYLEEDDSKAKVLEASYNEAVEHLKAADVITVNTLMQEIQMMLSPLSDGHTFAGGEYENERYLLDTAYLASEGYEIAAVNGISVEELFQEKSDLYCYEIEDWGIERMQGQLKRLGGLAFLGIDSSELTYSWANQAGEVIERTYTAADFVPVEEYLQEKEKYFSDDNEAFVYYEIDAEKSLAVLTLQQCIYNKEYLACLEDMFTEVKEQSIQNVAVDLRGNGGGNSMVSTAFIRYLDVDEYRTFTCPIIRRGPLNVAGDNTDNVMENQKQTDLLFSGNVYILTDASTFSAAMDFTDDIQGNELGIVIGESPANSPNSYGDITVFATPNTNILFQVSTKKWLRVNGDETDNIIHPDIECDGRDVYTYLYEEIENQTMQ